MASTVSIKSGRLERLKVGSSMNWSKPKGRWVTLEADGSREVLCSKRYPPAKQSRRWSQASYIALRGACMAGYLPRFIDSEKEVRTSSPA